MTDHIQDGGPAFPVIGAPGASEDFPGMTLRDYFAAKALAGMLANPEDDYAIEAYARTAYRVADAMLKARKS